MTMTNYLCDHYTDELAIVEKDHGTPVRYMVQQLILVIVTLDMLGTLRHLAKNNIPAELKEDIDNFSIIGVDFAATMSESFAAPVDKIMCMHLANTISNRVTKLHAEEVAREAHAKPDYAQHTRH